MESFFGGIVDVIYNLSLQEKQELLALLERNVSEARREEIYNSFLAAKDEEQQGKLKFSSDLSQLKNQF